MPFEIKALAGIDKQVAAYGAAVALSIAGVVGMTLSLGTLEEAATERADELAQMELEAEGILLPTDEERAGWATNQNLMASMLLADAEVPALMQEVTRLATLNRLDRFQLGTEEFAIEEGTELTPDQTLMQAVGIRRYMIVTVMFGTDFRNASQFVRDVGNLPRLAEFVSIRLVRGPSTVDAEISFRVYQRETAV